MRKHYIFKYGETTLADWYAEEEQIIVYSNCTDADKAKHLQNVLTIAKGICKYMKQEAVTVEINGSLQFIEA